MKTALYVFTISAFLLPAVSMAQSLPEPLKPIGNLSSPLNILIPNYSEVPPASAWQGFYLKPSIGYNSISFGGSPLNKANGVTLGASGGYDFRYDNIVFGPTADLNYDFLRGDEASIGGIYGFKPSINLDGSLGARAGLVWDRTLIYVIGGYAFAHMSVKNDALGLSDSNVLSGWTAGGGLEYLWSRNNSFQVEYRRVQFSDENFNSLPVAQSNVKFNMNKINIGFVHRF